MTPAERAAGAVLEIFTTGDYERIRDLVTEDFVDHGAPPGLPPGPDGYLGVPATGRPYAMHTMHLYRAEGDRLAEHWGVRDEHGVLAQVGALPAPTLPEGMA